MDKQLRARRTILATVEAELSAVDKLWETAFGGDSDEAGEAATKVDLTPDLLRRWFVDTMIQQPVRINDLARASVVDLLRLLDYPSDFVPVISKTTVPPDANADPNPPDQINVVDKSALNAQLAQSYVTELMDRARIK